MSYSRVPISIGHNCLPAAHLQALGLRRESYPFDWLLTPTHLSIPYVHDLIASDFADFITDLRYNDQGHVMAARYPDTLFLHHDLIANRCKVTTRFEPAPEDLRQVFARRAARFMAVLSQQPVLLIHAFDHCRADCAADYVESVRRLLGLLERRAVDYRLAVVLYDDRPFEPGTDFAPLETLKPVFLTRFVRDRQVNPYFGATETFAACMQPMLPPSDGGVSIETAHGM